MQGLAPDGGLYLMSRESLPRISDDDLAAFATAPYHEVAYRVIRPFVAGRVDNDTLRALCADAYDFDVPVEQYAPRRFLLRLDRGPTASFKDFAARMMARLMQHFLAKQGRRVTILTATSGDTGGAVADAFHGLDSARVVVLYPRGEVSDRQRRQMTTLGGNVHAVDVDGKFDDCQALVKQAFVDPELADFDLSSANSINVGRLIPQSVYYFYAVTRVMAQRDQPVCVCVPSGNFGNLMGGLLAKHMGLPIARFIAAVNENDEVPVYLRTADYQPVTPSRSCLSNAMNVGHPSNLARLVAFYGGVMDETGVVHSQPDLDAIRHDIQSVEVSDAETRSAIIDAYERFDIVIEPHGAVGYCGLEKLKAAKDYVTLLLETADPAKFPEVVTEMIGVDPPLPESMARQAAMDESMSECDADYTSFKSLLKSLVD